MPGAFEHDRNADDVIAPVAARLRFRLVITENARVLGTVKAFREGDISTAGRLVSASHTSLRDDFDVSTREIDRLVEIADSEHEVLGARITGGGFGGAVVALCRRPHAATIARRGIGSYRGLAERDGGVVLPRSA